MSALHTVNARSIEDVAEAPPALKLVSVVSVCDECGGSINDDCVRVFCDPCLDSSEATMRLVV